MQPRCPPTWETGPPVKRSAGIQEKRDRSHVSPHTRGHSHRKSVPAAFEDSTLWDLETGPPQNAYSNQPEATSGFIWL